MLPTPAVSSGTLINTSGIQSILIVESVGIVAGNGN